MDYRLTKQDEGFRKEFKDWLEKTFPKEETPPKLETIEEREKAYRDFQKKLFDAGYAGIRYDKRYGGRGGTMMEEIIVAEELDPYAETHAYGLNAIGMGMAGPVINAVGNEDQKKEFLPKLLDGSHIWCQGFSEPNAGSDLAGVQTTAVKDGDEWVINGQKCWTSGWDYGEWGFLLCRTDVSGPRHRNLGFFLFDCNTPGFSRRPLRQMTGETHAQYGELFFDDMRVPHENMVGEEGRGWYVAMTTLIAERGGGQVSAASGETGGMRMGLFGARTIGSVDSLIELARNTKHYGQTIWDDATFRRRIAQFAIENEALRAYGMRLGKMIRSGSVSGNEASMTKLTWTEQGKRRGDLLCEIIGAYSQLMRGDPRAIDGGDVVHGMLMSRGTTIFMGTSEICRNILAERILGLPRQ